MTRSINLILACVAMLAAAGAGLCDDAASSDGALARGVRHRRSHSSRVRRMEAVPGLQAVRPPPDGLEAEIYNQEVSRAFVDKEGHVVMLMIAYGESQSDRLQLHHPEVCYTAQGFRVTRAGHLDIRLVVIRASDRPDAPGCDPRGSDRADQLLDADRLRRHEQQLCAQRAQAGIRAEGMDSGRRAVPRLDDRTSRPRRASGFRTSSSGTC